MIKVDQPTCFPAAVAVAVSSKQDGQMQRGKAESNEEVNKNRQRFLKQSGIKNSTIALVNIRYGNDYSYDVITTIASKEDIDNLGRLTRSASDCIMTNQPNVTLFLPIADCVATAIYDPVNNVAALAHLGRHSSVAKLASKVVKQMNDQFQSKPEDLIVWMAPSIRPPHYAIARADFAENDTDWGNYCTKIKNGYSLDLSGYNRQLFIAAGVPAHQIIMSDVNTATDKNYWSHFTAVTKNNLPEPPRFAVAAMISDKI